MALVAGLALATALWSAVQAINAQARASYDRAEQALNQGNRPSLVAPGGALTVADYVALRRQGWQVSPVLEGRLSLAGQDIDLMGIDVLTSPVFGEVSSPESEDADGSFLISMLTGSGGVLVHPDTAARLAHLDTGFVLHASQMVPPGQAIADISVASRLLQVPDRLTRLILTEEPRPDEARLTGLPSHIVLEQKTVTADPGALTESFHLNLTAFGFLAFVVGLFIVQGTIGLAMEQRRGLFRTLRCLGVPLRHLLLTLLAEITVIALASSFIGLILGYFLAIALMPNVAATLSDLYGAQVDTGLSLRPVWILSGLAMTLLGAGLASAHSFHSLWKLPILQAPSTRARGQQVRRSFTGWALAGLALILLGSVLLATLGGLVGGFAFLGGVMLGAALLLPFCLWKLLRLGQSLSKSPLVHWLWADARAQLPGVSLALMALMLALATNIGVGSMVSSFRLTFTGWLDQRLASELYITAEGDAQGAQIQHWLEAQGIRVLPIRYHDMPRSTGRLRLYGVVDDTTYRDNWPMLERQPEVWDRVALGNGLLVSEQLARRDGLRLGAHLELPEGWPTEVLGIYSDYGNPHGQAILALPELLRNAPRTPNLRFGLRLDSEQVPDLMNNLRDRFELPRENMIRQHEIKAHSLAVFNQTFLVTDALKLLTLGVASFAIFTSLITLWTQRLPQLGPIWAMGVSRGTLAVMDILRSLILAGLTCLVALPLGLVLSWTLLVVINTEAFGWRLPVHLFPLDWLGLVALSLFAALLAALLPAWRLFRLHPSELLKVFASER
ncbi:FtsX-like permease family protein [Pseudophaeobacter sp.]|uniref:FtsX-like permease family protein n=1 Tax=Pseudophaeobacter sp. TaxID=1971739 RepID=UPI00329A0527